ncbi:MAG TPA: hypothetical protein VEA99_20010 [Gemmatimonadaceae bacterium]|nr:hypothetical protein [Gemmatimonadaceae bacterium]
MDARRYAEHGAQQRRQIRDAREARLAELRQRLWRFLEGHPCADCGERDPVVLEFHHTLHKDMDLNRLVAGAYSWPRLEEELALGIILCANCHRRREARARGYWRERFRAARLELTDKAD